MPEFSHFDEAGQAHMVDVGTKPISARSAQAGCEIHMNPQTLQMILSGEASKGDVLGVARIAGIMAAKRTADLIPLCHPLGLDAVQIEFQAIDDCHLAVTATVSTTGRTGVEMEALTAASLSALTVYDMCKSVDREMSVNQIRLLKKTGGKSGDFVREDTQPMHSRDPAQAEDTTPRRNG